MLLPSYEDATSHDYWNVVAPYVPSADLSSATLVCRRWHEIFAPYLWGNPASHFSTENDAIFNALSSFQRALPRARFYVRQMTHTLHLPPAHAEFYGGPHADWLLTTLRRLPNLQCLIVDGISLFDHAALLYTRRAITTVGGSSVGPAEFPLRVLSASRCLDCTHIGLSEALSHFTGLVYLDLSRTTGARHRSVLQALSKLPCLQSLKLRDVGLIDDDVRAIGQNTNLRLRSLDVRDNLLTNGAVSILLQHCFKYSVPAPPQYSVVPVQVVQSLPSALGTTNFPDHRNVDIGSLIHNRLALDISRDPAQGDDSLGGITDISLSGNGLSEQGVCAIIRTSRVQMLDAGHLSTCAGQGLETDRVCGPGSAESSPASESLISTLKHFGGSSLKRLRVHHSIVTGCVDDIVPGVNAPKSFDIHRSRPSGSTYARDSKHSEQDEEPDACIQTKTLRSQLELGDSPENPVPAHSPRTESGGRPRTFSASRKKREEFCRLRKATSVFLTPAHLPALDTLVLTDVPEVAYDSTIAERLIEFIKCCAAMTVLARDEARVAYHQPPGTSAVSFKEEYVRSVIALRQIVIEVKPSVGDDQAAPPCTPLASKSSTADEDSEAMWDAAENDFTFFEKGTNEGSTGHPPVSFYKDPEGPRAKREDESSRPQAIAATMQPTHNVISRLAQFRRDCFSAFEGAIENGLVEPVIEGYWPGEVRVERSRLD